MKLALLALGLASLQSTASEHIVYYKSGQSHCRYLSEYACQKAARFLGKHFVSATPDHPEGCYEASDGSVHYNRATQTWGASLQAGDDVAFAKQGRVGFGVLLDGFQLLQDARVRVKDSLSTVITDTLFQLSDVDSSSQNVELDVKALEWIEKDTADFHGDNEVCEFSTPFRTGDTVYADSTGVDIGIRNGDAGVAEGRTTTRSGHIRVRWTHRHSSSPAVSELSTGVLRHQRACTDSEVCTSAKDSSSNTWIEECLNLSAASARAPCGYGKEPLVEAAWSGAEANALTLLAGGAAINHTTDRGFSAVTAAAMQGHVAMLRLLVSLGANVDPVAMDHTTPLMNAASKGDAQSVLFLIGSGADVNLADGKGWTALNWAINGQADLDMPTMNSHGNCLTCVQYLAERQKDVNRKDGNGNTAIALAAQLGYTEAAQCLMKSGADPHVLNNMGQGAVVLAFLHAYPALAQYLQQAPLQTTKRPVPSATSGHKGVGRASPTSASPAVTGTASTTSATLTAHSNRTAATPAKMVAPPAELHLRSILVGSLLPLFALLPVVVCVGHSLLCRRKKSRRRAAPCAAPCTAPAAADTSTSSDGEEAEEADDAMEDSAAPPREEVELRRFLLHVEAEFAEVKPEPRPSSEESLERDAASEVERILGLRDAAAVLGGGTAQQQRAEYKRLVRLLHPDKGYTSGDRANLALRRVVECHGRLRAS